MVSIHINATLASDNIVAFNVIVAAVIPLFVMLMSTTMFWGEKRLENFSVLQIIRLYYPIHKEHVIS